MVPPDPDDARWRGNPQVPSSYRPPATPAPVEPSADERHQQLERFRRQRALEARLAADKTRQDPQRARGAWGTAERPDGWSSDEASSDERPARRRPILRLLAIATVTALLGSGAALLIVAVTTGTNPIDQWAGNDVVGQQVGPDGVAPPGGAPALDEWWGDDDAVVQQADPIDLPAPGPDPTVEPEPLGTPPPMPVESGNYRFLAGQPTSEQPVAYDPCRPIRYLVNDADAPPGGDQLIAEALAAVSAATGLVFEPVGRTDETPSAASETVRGDDDSWPPVNIAWTNPTIEPELDGNVAGFAGSTRVEAHTTSASGETVQQTAVYVTGVIGLDGPQIADLIARSPNGWAEALAVVKHEAGHLVGLGHVDDPGEIMNPVGTPGVTEFGPGDLRGLNHLGRGPCVPEI